jgi:hypothetical protein
MSRSTVSRSLHDLALAAWFGGTLANAVALNPAAGEPADPTDRARVANAGWDRWTPLNAAAIGMHLAGSVGQLIDNRGRVAPRHGVGTIAVFKTGLTAAALGVTAYSRVVGRRVSQREAVPVQDGITPTAATPDDATRRSAS